MLQATFSSSCCRYVSTKAFRLQYTDNIQILFAASASVLVKQFALDAKQSGIPELKTVLSGFVMRKLLGTWVLVVKSIGLVSDGRTSRPSKLC